MKSLQLRLNELSVGFMQMPHITKSAYSQARQKLRHTVFIELDKLLTSTYYIVPLLIKTTSPFFNSLFKRTFYTAYLGFSGTPP